MKDEEIEQLRVTETGEGILLYLHVQPRASKNEICGVHGNELKVRLTSPPVDDAANKTCIEFLAKKVGVPKSSVAIVAGGKSRHKTILIKGITPQHILGLLS